MFMKFRTLLQMIAKVAAAETAKTEMHWQLQRAERDWNGNAILVC